MIFDTIAAIASGGHVNQAISIIRVSGPEALEIVQKITNAKVGKLNEITYGWILDQGEKVDEVLIGWFPGTKNFIGENTVEIYAHGGIVVSNNILELLITHGCRLATPGEFSKRAFLNGKMDLVKAEAINDLIHAQTKNQTKLAIKKFDNQTSKLITNLITKISYLIGICEVNIDYPEYDDVEIITNNTLLPQLFEIKKDLEKIIEVSEQARIIYDGLNVAIVGQPNVGKSSLLNALINEDKAIVSNIAGTTRDIVEGKYQFNNFLLKFQDTAGIRESNDLVESIGIQKSLATIKNADLVIHVLDMSQTWSNIDEEIYKLSQDKKYLQVYNKSDLHNITTQNQDKIFISALNKDIDQLTLVISQIFENIDIDNPMIVNNTRQLSLIKKAKITIEEAILGLNNGYGFEVIIIDIYQAWEELSNILGQANKEDLLDTMFSHFCLGK